MFGGLKTFIARYRGKSNNQEGCALGKSFPNIFPIIVFCIIGISHLKELEERAYWYSVESQSGRQPQLSLLTRAMMLRKSAVLEELAKIMMTIPI